MAKLYKNLTIAARMEMFITKDMGFVAIPSRNKYKMFEREVIKNSVKFNQYLFLGKNGAVRISTKKNVAQSFSFTDTFLKMLGDYEQTNNLMETK
jgi:hypothetical protein